MFTVTYHDKAASDGKIIIYFEIIIILGGRKFLAFIGNPSSRIYIPRQYIDFFKHLLNIN